MKINDITLLGYSAPVLRKGKKPYVEFYFINSLSKPERKRYYIKKNESKLVNAYGTMLCQKLFSLLAAGWRPEKRMKIVLKDECKNIRDVIAEYEKYIDNIQQQKTLKYKTYIDYRSRLKILKEYLFVTQTIKLEDFNQNFCSLFLDWLLTDKKVSCKTRNNYRTWLSTFCTWLTERSYIPVNYIKNLKVLKEEEKKRDALTQEELEKLSAYLQEHDKNLLLACMFEYYTFIRPNELSYLKIKDLYLKEQKVFVSRDISKNRHDGTVALNRRIIELLIDLEVFKYPDNYYLFGCGCKPAAQKADSRQFNYYFQKARKALRFPVTYKFYSLKDSGIRDLANAKGIVMARDQARHSDISTTNCYLKGPGKVHDELKTFEGAL